MKRHLHVHRSRTGAKGSSFAVAMLVVALLSIGGIVALNAASYDVSTAGAIRAASHSGTVSETGLAVGRCEMCDSIDGMTVAMQQVRENEGRSPEFVMRDEDLQARLTPATAFFEAPSPAPVSRGSFGFIGAIAPTIDFTVRVDRPRESGGVAGYAMREGAGADSGTLCFRQYRVTSEGTFTQPLVTTTEGATTSTHRAYITAGPVECSM